MGADMKNMCGCVYKGSNNNEEIHLVQAQDGNEGNASLQLRAAKNKNTYICDSDIGFVKNDLEEKQNHANEDINTMVDILIRQKGGEFVLESQWEEFNSNEKIYQLRQKIDFSSKTEYENHITFERGPVFFPSSNEMYKGSWDSNGNKCGYGILKAANKCYYEGFFQNDILSGDALVIDSKCDYYKGSIVNGKAEGIGEYVRSDGTRYYGQWKNDFMEGTGTESFENGIYKGEFKNGEKNGLGELELNDGSKYTGQFNDNNIHGEGTFVWSDGRTYKGSWENNKMHGYGVFTFSDGRRYEGEYKNDVKEGKGKYFWSEDKYYDGEFLEGKRHGKGIIYNNGKTFKGVWKNGKLVNDKDLILSLNGDGAS